MQHRNFSAGGFSGAIFAIIFIAIIFIIFQFKFQGVLMAASPEGKAVVRLSWTAPGDDGVSGCASEYDIRYSLDSLTEENWDSATRVKNVPAPKPAGEKETLVVSGLELNTPYYFAIKTADECYNWSGISGVVRVIPAIEYICGDVTGEGEVDVSDVVGIVNYIFLGGEISGPYQSADTNCDGCIDVSDAVYISNYIFMDGNSPCDINNDSIQDC